MIFFNLCPIYFYTEGNKTANVNENSNSTEEFRKKVDKCSIEYIYQRQTSLLDP
jgi:hypothetical protein